MSRRVSSILDPPKFPSFICGLVGRLTWNGDVDSLGQKKVLDDLHGASSIVGFMQPRLAYYVTAISTVALSATTRFQSQPCRYGLAMPSSRGDGQRPRHG